MVGGKVLLTYRSEIEFKVVKYHESIVMGNRFQSHRELVYIVKGPSEDHATVCGTPAPRFVKKERF